MDTKLSVVEYESVVIEDFVIQKLLMLIVLNFISDLRSYLDEFLD
jgi:hypothetical protein